MGDRKTGDPNRWCWCVPQSESVHGPYESRDECIADAKEYVGDVGVNGLRRARIEIGHPRDIVPEEYAATAWSVDDILEQMEYNASDAGCGFDDSIFELAESKKGDAGAALEAMLKEWARQWVVCDHWMMGGPFEEIEIEVPVATEPPHGTARHFAFKPPKW